MGFATALNGTLRTFIARQKLFFVATAAEGGRVNVSPKGADSLRVVNDRRLRWLNLSGSGNETAGHVRACNRITLMFCAFEGDALILRVYGRATPILPQDEGWAAALADFPAMAGSRTVFDVEVEGVQTSCGTGVPLMTYAGERAETELIPFFEEMGPDGVRDYWRRKNLQTIDGLPTGLRPD